MNLNNKTEYSKEVHEQIIRWTENCDSKASIMMALVGILMSIIFTSDFIINSIKKLISPVIIYYKNGIGSFDVFSFIIFIFLFGFLISLFIAIYHLFNVLYGKIGKDRNTGFIFFNHIKNHNNEKEYNEALNNIDDEKILDERLKEIYICSKRCSEKFISYNNSFKYIIISLTCFVISVILMLVIN